MLSVLLGGLCAGFFSWQFRFDAYTQIDVFKFQTPSDVGKQIFEAKLSSDRAGEICVVGPYDNTGRVTPSERSLYLVYTVDDNLHEVFEFPRSQFGVGHYGERHSLDLTELFLDNYSGGCSAVKPGAILTVRLLKIDRKTNRTEFTLDARISQSDQ